MTGFNTTDTTPNKITSLIEQRIRDDVQGEGRKAVDAFAALIEAEIEKLGVYASMTSMHSLIREMRTKHIDSLVNRRIDELVTQLVPDQGSRNQDSHQDEPAAPVDANTTFACLLDVTVPPGATLIIECGQLLTNEQKEAVEARALSKLPAGCQVLVLDRGLKASLTVQAADAL